MPEQLEGSLGSRGESVASVAGHPPSTATLSPLCQTASRGTRHALNFYLDF
jgi:hypothetical protein